MTKDNQTTISYGDEIAEWVESFTNSMGTSKASAFRYAVKQQIEREKVEE